ncbi:MAG: hypothetical protein OHK0038_02380 [Flammeovirgaceae bacterium]
MIPAEVNILGTKLILTESARNMIFEKYTSITKSTTIYQQSLKKCDYYFPQIEKAFEQEEVPLDMKYLAFQESNLNPEASRKTETAYGKYSVGFWQFFEPTARENDLRVDEGDAALIDERKNAFTSSLAAAKYFKANANKLGGSWIFAVLAHNKGAGGAKKIITERNLDKNKVLIEGDKDFQYIIHFLAHYFAFKDELGKTPQERALISFTTNNTTLEDVASILDLNPTEIKAANPWILRGDMIPDDKVYAVLIPSPTDKTQELLAALTPAGKPLMRRDRKNLFYSDSIVSAYPFVFEDPSLQAKDKKHIFALTNGIKSIVAQKGDRVKKLAKVAGISAKKFRSFNDLKGNAELKEGVTYYIEAKPQKLEVGFYHKVQKGETIESIANKYGINTKSLMLLNGLQKGETLMKGRKIYFN